MSVSQPFLCHRLRNSIVPQPREPNWDWAHPPIVSLSVNIRSRNSWLTIRWGCPQMTTRASMSWGRSGRGVHTQLWVSCDALVWMASWIVPSIKPCSSLRFPSCGPPWPYSGWHSSVGWNIGWFTHATLTNLALRIRPNEQITRFTKTEVLSYDVWIRLGNLFCLQHVFLGGNCCFAAFFLWLKPFVASDLRTALMMRCAELPLDLPAAIFFWVPSNKTTTWEPKFWAETIPNRSPRFCKKTVQQKLAIYFW